MDDPSQEIPTGRNTERLPDVSLASDAERDRWARIQRLFHEVVELPAAERLSYLQQACGDDATIHDAVLAMLKADEEGKSLLDRGLPQVAMEMIGVESGEPPAEVIGSYRLVRLLGEGGMGVVWLARHMEFGNEVAVKFLLHAGLSPARRERFRQETRTLAKLHHPWIARLYDAGTLDNGTPWFVMEYVNGVPLTQYRPTLAVEPRLRLFRRVCEAVLFAHSQTVIHRDLKPSNILIEDDGTPRLLDFGIAREIQKLDESTGDPAQGLTGPGPRFMSPHHAAPEWIREGVVNFSTDVYALGVLLYELLTGKLPFPDANAILASAATGQTMEPEKPSHAAREAVKTGHSSGALSRSAWADLDVLCLKALHPDPTARYQSVEALIRDIDHYLLGEPLEARPDAFSYKLSKFLKRNRRSVWAAAIVVLLIVALIAGFTFRLTRARDQALAEAARTRRIQTFMLFLLGGADPAAAPSRDLRVVTLLDRGVKSAESLSSDPETQAELYENLGNMYDKLGQYPKAEQLLKLALDNRKKVLPAADPRIAETLVRIGIVKADESQFKEAEHYAQLGLDMAETTQALDSPQVLAAKSALGLVIAESGDFKRSLPLLEPLAQRQPRTMEERYTQSEILNTLSVVYYSVGNQAKAEELSRRSVALDSGLFGANHPQVATDLTNVGLSLDLFSKETEAETSFRQAEQILTAWYGADHPDVAMVRVRIARSLVAQGHSAEAAAILREVLASQERIYQGPNEQIAITLDTMASIATSQGNYAEAESDLTRCVAMMHTLFGDENQDTAMFTADLGSAYLHEKRYALADITLATSIKNMLATIPPEALNIASARADWGHALIALKRYKEAEEPLEDSAKIFEAQPSPPRDQIHAIHQDLATVYLALHQPDKARAIQTETAQTKPVKAAS